MAPVPRRLQAQGIGAVHWVVQDVGVAGERLRVAEVARQWVDAGPAALARIVLPKPGVVETGLGVVFHPCEAVVGGYSTRTRPAGELPERLIRTRHPVSSLSGQGSC